jgi:predicted O-methyltransferase YrrM
MPGRAARGRHLIEVRLRPAMRGSTAFSTGRKEIMMIAPDQVPPLVLRAEVRAAAEDFDRSFSRETGSLLRTLVGAKRGGLFLELGTGLGVCAAWMLAGMDPTARLITIEIRPEAAKISAEMLDGDPRVEVLNVDACAWLEAYEGPDFDLIFADVGILKYERRDLTLSMLAMGGFFVGDDLLPQPKWLATHPARVEKFRSEIADESTLTVTMLDWGSGIALATRVA